MPSFWPHIWAIPLVFVAGFVLGWSMRTMASGGPPAGSNPRPDDLDD